VININPLDDTFTNPELKDSFFVNSLFASSPVRSSILNGTGSYIPVFLNEMPRLFDDRILPLDAAFIQVSPPDKHGFCSLGISVEVTRAAIRNAKRVFAQINRNMPRVHGDTFVHINDIHSYVEYDEPLIELNHAKSITKAERQIGKRVAELIADGSTSKLTIDSRVRMTINCCNRLVQVGIGPIPDSILSCLENHKDLSIATEMLSDGAMILLEKGVVTNRYKKFHPGKSTCTFILGTKALYDFVDDNPNVLALDVVTTNDPALIRQNPRMCAINSALEIDLTGQICADSLGTMQYSGVGGQMDFMRGAALSEQGKPIIVLPSQTSKGISRIVNTVGSEGV
jgi:4-hydroxybutyrate CoA-transferase